MDKTSKRILVAPLDWGLGHVSRCVPLIQYIIACGHQVILAGNEVQLKYLQKIFPETQTLKLDGYNVQYSKSKLGFIPKILLQIPRIKNVIKFEHAWLQEQIKVHRIDAVISDNRYGLYSTSVPCVLMTHQLHVLSGKAAFVDSLLQKLHYKFIERFDQCWVVDMQTENGWAGILSHPELLPSIPTKYIGLLSQCAEENIAYQAENSDNYLLILLSGTEPQRSIMSEILWQQSISFSGKIIFVEGTELVQTPALIPPHIQYKKLVHKPELHQLISVASFVICRSGYSSIMDLMAFGKKAILIPTPGQTEQEYLAEYLQEGGVFLRASQTNFNLIEITERAQSFPFCSYQKNLNFEQFKIVVDELLQELT